MTKYYFYYYFTHGIVWCGKVVEFNGVTVGGPINPIPGNKFEITEYEWLHYTLFDLKGKYEYQDGGSND